MFRLNFAGSQLRVAVLSVINGSVCLLLSVPLWGQQPNGRESQEFIRSSSPLGGDAMVTSDWRPDQGNRVIVTSNAIRSGNLVVSPGLQVAQRPQQEPAFTGSSVPQSVMDDQLPADAAGSSTAAPAQTVPAITSEGQVLIPGGTDTAASPGAGQIPTWGTYRPYVGVQLPRIQRRAGQRIIFPAVNTVGYTSPLTCRNGRWFSNYQNAPSGTYLGRGMLGQPTAYVDGQPVRNMLRFITFP